MSSDFDDIPVVTKASNVPRTVDEYLATTPVTNSLSDSLIDFPAAYDDGESVPANTRIPIQWTSLIEEIRDKVGTKLPRDIWRTRGHFYRWCIAMGMQKARSMQMALDSGDIESLDPISDAQLFLERRAGNLAARADAMATARKNAEKVSNAVNDLMQIDEPTEAADMISQWFDGCEDLSPFWRTYMHDAILKAPNMAAYIKELIDGGYISTEPLLDLYDRLTEIDNAQHDEQTNLDNIATDI